MIKTAYLHTVEIMLAYTGVALRILGVTPTVGEKGVSLKVGEAFVSHLNPLHASASRSFFLLA